MNEAKPYTFNESKPTFPHKQDDICMQCGHTRSLHNQDGCQCFILNPKYYKTVREEEMYIPPDSYIKCGCVVDCYQGKIIKRVN